MPEPREHMKERNWLETLLHKIPGFRGYLDKEDRLQRCKRALDDYTRTLADSGQIAHLPRYDRLRGQIDKLIGRIQGAMQGYSGVFDLVRVDEALLDRVYEHDVILIERVENVATTVEKLQKSSGESQAATLVGQLSAEIDEVERAWDRREDLLKGLE
jgi:hypothetical protein